MDTKFELHCGDCLEVMPQLDCKVGAVITDPPYGTTACAWDSVIPFEPMWDCIKGVIEERAAVVLFGSQPFTSALVMSNPKWFKYEWIWEKSQATGHLNAWKRPMRKTEDVVVFSPASNQYNPILTDKPYENIRPVTERTRQSECYGNHDVSVFRCPPDKSMPANILRFNNAQGTEHPTQKPVPLLEYLIKTYTNEGDTVLDFTMGSGTTGVACMNTGRHFIGIEKDSAYFETAKQRIEEAAKPLPLFADVDS